MVKINVGTALNIAFTGVVRATLAEQESSDPRKYLAPARDAMSAVVADLLRVVSG
jgi:fructose-bisphosphate aldolase class II